MTFQRAEVWSELVSKNGSRLSVIAAPSRCEGREDLAGGDVVELDFPLADQATAHLKVRRVIRLVFSDTFSEWRIDSIRGVNGESGGLITVVATTPLLDMADAGTITETLDSGVVNYELAFTQLTAEQILDNVILPALATFGQSYWFKGVVEPTALLSPTFSAQTPLGAIRILLDLARNPETNRPAELRIRRNGTTGYYIDILTEIGANLADGVTPQPIADLRYLKNLRTTDHTEDGTEQATVVTPLGDALPDGTITGIAQVAFRLDNESPSGTFEITDPETGLSPVLEDGFLSSGFYVIPDGNGAPIEITGSVAAVGLTPAKVSVASTSGITEGNVYGLIRNAGIVIQPMTELVSIANFATYGRKAATVVRSGFTGVRNLIRNPWFRVWSDPADAPNEWETDTGGAPFTDYMAQGTDPSIAELSGKSVTFSQSSDGGPVFGIKTGVIYPQAVDGAQFFAVKCRVLFEEFSGSSWFYLQLRPGSGGALIAGVTVISAQNLVEQGQSPATGIAVDVIIQDVDLGAWNADGVRVHVRSGAGGGYGATTPGVITAHVIGTALYQQTGPVVPAYYEYSGANAIWAAGVRALAANAAPPARYELDVDDLTRFDAVANPYDELVNGATVWLTDAALSLNRTPLRIVGKPLIDYLTPKRTRLAVATRAQLLAEYLVSGAVSSPAPTTTTKPGTLTPTPAGAIGRATVHIEFGETAAGETVIDEEFPATATEVSPPIRRFADLTGVKRAGLAGHVIVAVAGATYFLKYSTDASTWNNPNPTWAGELGPMLSGAATGDIPPLAFDVAGDAQRLVLLSLWQRGGDGAAALEHGSITLMGAVLPRTDRAPDPPDGVVPALNLLLDLDMPRHGEVAGLADNDPAPSCTDFSGNANHAAVNLGSYGQTAPTYKANGLGTGFASFRFAALGNDGLTFAMPASDSVTWYMVYGNAVGAGTAANDANQNGTFLEGWQVGQVDSFCGSMRANGKLVWNLRSSVFTNTNQETAAAWDGATVRILRFTWDRLIGNWTIKINGTTVASLTDASATQVLNVVNTCRLGKGLNASPMSYDLGRVLCYSGAHTAAQAETVEAVLRTQFGL